MRKQLILVFLLLTGIINFVLTIASHEFPNLFPPFIYGILVSISMLIFIGLWMDYRFRHPLSFKEIMVMGLVIYPVLAGFLNDDSILIGTLNPMVEGPHTLMSLTNLQVLKGMYYGSSVGMLFYTLGFFARDLKTAKPLYDLMAKGVLIFVMIAVAYSLMMEWDAYVFVYQFFDEGARMSLASFTSNPNIYAFNLMMGLYAVGALWQSERTWRWLYLSLGFLLMGLIIMTVSKTVMLGMMVYLVVYGFLTLHQALTDWPRLRPYALLATALILVVGLHQVMQSSLPFFVRFQTLLSSTAFSSWISRTRIWMNGIWLIKEANTLLGYGFGLSNTFLGVATATPLRLATMGYQVINDRFHNGYLEVLVSFGLIGTTLLTIVHVGYLKALAKLFKHHPIAIPMWALIISFAVMMVFEDRILFRPDLGGVFFLALLLLPFHQPTRYNRRHEA